jgi:exopolysaccharide biosynthesis protein
MKLFKYVLSLTLATALLSNNPTFASTSSFQNTNINGINMNYVDINMNSNIKAAVLNADNQMNSSDSLANMAKNVGAFAAINGTYFEAYNGTPVPWGTIIKNGKIIHISNGGSVAGITSEGELIIDRLSFDFEVYINGKFRSIPWRINHPSTEADAITIFTPEYGSTVKLQPGAKAAIIKNGKVSEICISDFVVPNDGFAVVYNPSVVYLLDERFKTGDEVYYNVIIKTTFTNAEDWNDVVSALGAGPSLIINGTVTADGLAEGFFEDKINTNSASRSFIGTKSDGTITIGSMGSATVKNAAEALNQMGFVNAMCLDGGGSVALYYPTSNVSTSGRKINNGLAFVEEKITGITAVPTSSKVLLDGNDVNIEAYNIDNSNYFKLRDIAMILDGSKKSFNVEWDNSKNAINIVKNKKYSPVGAELSKVQEKSNKSAVKSSSEVYLNGKKITLTAYNIDGSNYFKLRDIAGTLDFEVIWDAVQNSVVIETKID